MRIDSSPRWLARHFHMDRHQRAGIKTVRSRLFARYAPARETLYERRKSEWRHPALRQFALYKDRPHMLAQAVHYIAVMHDRAERKLARRKWRAHFSTMLIARFTPRKTVRVGQQDSVCLCLQRRIDFQHFNIKVNGVPASGWLKINGNRVAVDFANHAVHFPLPSIAVKAIAPILRFARRHKPHGREKWIKSGLGTPNAASGPAKTLSFSPSSTPEAAAPDLRESYIAKHGNRAVLPLLRVDSAVGAIIQFQGEVNEIALLW